MRTRYRMERRALLTGGTALALTAVAGARVPLAQTLDKVSFQTNWRAQAEHGGYYQAVAAGIYRRHGIECEIRMGGPQQNPAQLLLAGRVDFIMSNGFQALNYVREGLPFLTVGAIMQKDPQVLMTHEGNGINSFEDMKGRPILIGASGRVTYWPFLKAKFGFTDEQIRPYTFNVGPFLADRMAIQQGFISSEPFAAQQAGARPRVFLIADAGYQNYQTTIDVSQRMVNEKKDLVQRFVNATIEGWSAYMKGQDVAGANAAIKRDNPEMDDAKIAYAVQVMNQAGIVASGDALTMGIGAMTEARWKSFYEGMRDVGRYPAGLDYAKAYSLEFVNKRVGLA
ncbi:ABC transporter substrate-binding protein [Falsiroseomonas selenitidurans]|uniref:ABC transporter substrate-binding protein n=1 Tax=Falsiroseomonas selenitidurans TaxID=2716335 RepID=A0ABX1E0U7_9PROT|nr:ABC transporter substrate-binding protein [Falsiroseomonas selenitidurans]NKC30781.1 ABC transporter substrate-binding protein [Falsiroseomonas selenitidurans]